jgi:hypothetical protein
MNYILPEFQKFVTQRKLAPESQIPFYARWASKFLRFSNTRQDKPLFNNPNVSRCSEARQETSKLAIHELNLALSFGVFSGSIRYRQPIRMV